MIKEVLKMKWYECKMIKFFVDDLFYRMITFNLIFIIVDFFACLMLLLSFVFLTPINILIAVGSTILFDKKRKEQILEEYKSKNDETTQKIILIREALTNMD